MTAIANTASTAAAADVQGQGINAFKPRILHTAYFVADIERSLKFYVDALGMKEQQRFDLGNGVHEVVLQFPDSRGGGIILMWNTTRKNAYQHGDGYSRVVLSVNDLSATIGYLKSKGIAIDKGPVDAGSLIYCLVKDPDGYVLELLQLKRADPG